LELIGARSGMVVLKRCVDVDEALATSTAGQADAAVVALDAPGLDPTAVEVLHRHDVRVVAVGPDDDAARTRGARVGADALVAPDDLELLPEALEADVDDPTFVELTDDDLDVADTPTPSGRTVAVWGPAGAPGRTTVAVSLASAVARRG